MKRITDDQKKIVRKANQYTKDAPNKSTFDVLLTFILFLASVFVDLPFCIVLLYFIKFIYLTIIFVCIIYFVIFACIIYAYNVPNLGQVFRRTFLERVLLFVVKPCS